MHAALGTFYITTVKLIRRHIARLSQIHIVLRYVLRDKYPTRALPGPLVSSSSTTCLPLENRWSAVWHWLIACPTMLAVEFSRARLFLILAVTEDSSMLRWALIFFIVALMAAVLGFTGIALAAAGVAKILFYIFVILFVLSLLGHVARRP